MGWQCAVGQLAAPPLCPQSGDLFLPPHLQRIATLLKNVQSQGQGWPVVLSKGSHTEGNINQPQKCMWFLHM